MRVVFAGTPEFAATILAALIDSRHTVACVYTQPDRRAGRGRRLTPGPVKRLAGAHEIPVSQPATLKGAEEIESLRRHGAEVMVVAAYGLLLPRGILEVPPRGCLNVHASILPRWRGAAPVQRAILAGDAATGISIMQMDEGLDTGAVLMTRGIDIDADDTAASLTPRLARLGAGLLLESLDGLEAGTLTATHQDPAAACHAPRIQKHEAAIDWRHDAESLARRVRAFNPWPVAYSHLPGSGEPDTRRLRIWHARARDDGPAAEAPGTVVGAGTDGIAVATGRGVLCLTRVQAPGSRVMDAADFLNARPLAPGARLGEA